MSLAGFACQRFPVQSFFVVRVATFSVLISRWCRNYVQLLPIRVCVVFGIVIDDCVNLVRVYDLDGGP